MKNKIKLAAATSILLGSLAVTIPTFAQGPHWGDNDNDNDGASGRGPGMGMMMHGVFGTVSSISGNTITITSKGFGQNTTEKTYTVDATNAKVTKDGASSSVSAIAVGDNIMVRGTITDTNVVATDIYDGKIGPRTNWSNGQKLQASPIIQGNGQPIVGGTVSSISGSSITITNKSNATYTVDASSAVVAKNNATSSVSEIAVGDNLIIQGAVNGNSITASSIIDRATPNIATNPNNSGGIVRKFFGRMGGFFHSLFGFF